MIIVILLTTGLLIFFIYGLAQKNRSSIISLMIYVTSIAGVYFVWLPSHATYIAEKIGVGRGADLVLYSCIIIGLIIALNIHIKFRKMLALITQITRHIAIESVMLPEGRGAKDNHRSPEDQPEIGRPSHANQQALISVSKENPKC
jgi:hypothetical protein